MPYRYYHGRTGQVFHVVNRAVGVLVNKRVRHRIMVKKNAAAVAAAKGGAEKVSLKRIPRQPRPGIMVEMGDKPVIPLKIRAAVEVVH